MQELTSQLLSFADSSFKYVLIVFNFMTLIVVYWHKNRQKHKKQHHVLFVTAHPDDEIMFFRPSLVSINKQYFVHLLCLTGKQTERGKQFQDSAQKLNVHKFECLNNQKLKDSIEITWPKDEIKLIVLKYIEENNIKAIFTFDSFGVSGHSNHRSIHQALKDLQCPKDQLKILNKKAECMTQEQKKLVQQIKQTTIKIYYLNSVNVIRKYSGFLQIFIALLRDYCWINLNFIDGYLSMSIHKSQFVWYRKLWVFFSQYNYINFYNMTRIRINVGQKMITEKKMEPEKSDQNLKTNQGIEQKKQK